MSYQRRAELTRMVQDLRKKHGCSDELKWQKAHSKRNAAFYSDVIDVFFRHNWMAFHCIIVEKSKVEKSYHGGDYDLAMRKHFCKLIETKIGNVIQRWPHAECEFLIEVDPLPSRYKKADEEFHIIANHSLARKYGRKDIIKLVETKDSKTSEHIQLVDFFIRGCNVCISKESHFSSETGYGRENRFLSWVGIITARYLADRAKIQYLVVF